MAVEEVVIKITKDTKGVEDTVKQLEKLGEVDKKNAEQFKKANEQQKTAYDKRMDNLKKEEQELERLQKASKKAYSAEDINAYNNLIKESKNRISLLRGETEKLDKSSDMLTKGFKRVGAAIVAAFAVSKIVEFGKAVIASTQATGDRWNELMGGMRESTDYFFRAIASGDWSNLIDGLKEAFKEGERYAQMLDLIADQTRAMNIQVSSFDLLIAKQEEISRSSKNTAQERMAAINEIKRLEDLRAAEIREIRQKEYDNEVQHSQSITKLSESALKYIMGNQDAHQLMMEAKDKDNKYKALNRVIDATTGEITFDEKAYQNWLKIQGEKFNWALFFANKMSDLADENRIKLEKSIVNLNQVEIQNIQSKNQQLRRENGLRAELNAAEQKRLDERIKKEREADRLRIEVMSDGAAKEQALEEMRYEEYLDKYGESEDALKLHLQKMQAIRDKYNDQIFKAELERQNMAELAREYYRKMIQDAIDAEDKEAEHLAKQAEKQAQEYEKRRKEQVESYIDFVQSITDYTFDTISDRHDLIMKMLDSEIDKQESNIEQQQRLAERGLNNTLSFEQTKLRELEKQRIEAEKKEDRRQKAALAAKLVISFIEAYNRNLETMQPTPALTKAFRDTMMAKILGTAIGSMYEDGGVVGADGKPLRGGILTGPRHSQGGIPIVAEGGEGILSRKEVANMGVANFYNLKQMLKSPINDSIKKGGNVDVANGFLMLNDTLKSIPSIHYGIDNLNQIVKTEVHRGMKNITTYKRGIN